VSVDIRQSTLVRTIALRVAVKGAPASGYRVVNVVVSPATITVEGSLDALQQVDAIDLDSVDVTGELTKVTRAVTVELPDGLLTSENRVVTVVVQIAPIDGDFTLSLAPRIVGLGDGLAINAVESVEITLSGPLPLLTQLTADDIGISLDVSGLGAGVHAVEVQLTVPEGMVLKSLQPETVSVTLAIG
jgi:YbbR domain-containing protein